MSSFKRYGVRVPVIRVIDTTDNYVHLVGSDSHDRLYIDDKTGGIQYYNLQDGDGTGTYGEYKFVGGMIEFVTIDELMEIYKSEMELDTEKEIRELCEYCHKGEYYCKPFIVTSTDTEDVWVRIDHEEEAYLIIDTYYETDYDDCNRQFKLNNPINYCPMCGRKLE